MSSEKSYKGQGKIKKILEFCHIAHIDHAKPMNINLNNTYYLACQNRLRTVFFSSFEFFFFF